MRLLERAARRAELPLRYSQGFNPHPLISYPYARPAGVAGGGEIVEMDLASPVAPAKVAERLNAQAPEGVRFEDACAVRPKARAQVTGLVYVAEMTTSQALASGAVDDLLARSEIPVVRTRGRRGTRTVDIRPFIRDVRWEPPVVTIELAVVAEGTARVNEVLEELGASWPGDVRRVSRSVEAMLPGVVRGWMSEGRT